MAERRTITPDELATLRTYGNTNSMRFGTPIVTALLNSAEDGLDAQDLRNLLDELIAIEGPQPGDFSWFKKVEATLERIKARKS